MILCPFKNSLPFCTEGLLATLLLASIPVNLCVPVQGKTLES